MRRATWRGHRSARLTELGSGVRSELPLALGVIPFGMIYGVLALAAGIPPLLAQGMSAIVFAGSAQFIGTQLIGAGTPGAIIIFTTFVVNLRHLLYSASVAPHLRHLAAYWKWLLAYLLTDEAYVVTILNFESDTHEDRKKHWFLLGAGLTLWSCWQASTAMGIFLGTQIPASWSLDFTLALTFIGIVIPALDRRSDVAAVLVAGTTATIASAWPYQLGLIAAAVAGIVAGMVAQRFE